MTIDNGGWQPIETAPKDGTIIDLWRDGQRLPNCRWKGDGFSGWEWISAPKTMIGSRVILTADPTHWMPLPPPPADAMLAARGGDA